MGIFNNRLLFSLLFLVNLLEGKAVMEGDKVVMGLPQYPTGETLTGAVNMTTPP